MRRVPHPDAPDLSELVGDVVAFRRDVVFRHPQVGRVADLARFGDVEVLWQDLLLRGTRRPAFRVVRAGITVAGHDVELTQSAPYVSVANQVPLAYQLLGHQLLPYVTQRPPLCLHEKRCTSGV